MGRNSPSFLGIWKKDDITGDVDGRRYPFASSSSNHLRKACLFFSGSGYILQLIESGALGLNSIVWSHGCDGGKRCDSSLMNSNRLGRYTHIRGVCEKCAVGVNLEQKQVMATVTPVR